MGDLSDIVILTCNACTLLANVIVLLLLIKIDRE